MQMYAMNQFGNRGFGGPPQPQRQGGRRGNNRGGFRNSRFDHNNPHQNHQGGPNQGQGGQRPQGGAEVQQAKPSPTPEKPAVQQPPQQQNVPQNKPPQQAQQSNSPQLVQQNKPLQQAQQNKPMQQAQQNKPPQQQQQQLAKPPQQPAQQQKPVEHVQTQQPKSVQNTPAKPVSQDNVDKAANEPKPLMQINTPSLMQQKNVNGNFQGNKQQGGWAQGGQGNKQGGGFNNQDGGRPFNQDAGRPFNNQEGGRPFNNQEGGKPFNNQEGGRPFNNQEGGRPFNNQEGGRPFNNQGSKFGQKPSGPGGPARNQRGGRTGPGGGNKDGMPAREEHMLAHKLKDLVGPLIDIPPVDQSEVKFNGRSRLYIGNLTNEMSEEEVQNLFSQFGECAELFVNKEKNFGFIKMDYRVNAERAKRELDGQVKNGRPLRVRFAPHNCAIRVKNLPPFVSNELLYRAFEIFGRIERAYVRVDERGKSLGEGIVEFSRKPSALAAIRNCTEKCFFLTASLRPVIVESFEEPDELDGYPEKNIPKKHPEYLKSREIGPRFSEQNSFEHEYGTRWKQLHELHRQKEEALKKELAAEEEKLEAQMEYAKYEHETELLREQLRQREQDRERQKRSWEMAERAADTRREAERAQLLRQEEELSQRMRHQDDELRRRQQENTLFVQAQRLNSMLDRQEQGMFDQQSPMDGGFREQYDMPRGGSFDDLPQGRGWEGPRQMDDYPNKRRRY